MDRWVEIYIFFTCLHVFIPFPVIFSFRFTFRENIKRSEKNSFTLIITLVPIFVGVMLYFGSFCKIKGCLDGWNVFCVFFPSYLCLSGAIQNRCFCYWRFNYFPTHSGKEATLLRSGLGPKNKWATPMRNGRLGWMVGRSMKPLVKL